MIPSVFRCCWLGLLTCKTHYRVGEPTAAWQFVDIVNIDCLTMVDNTWAADKIDSCLWVVLQSIKWLSTIMRERRIPPDSESGGIPHLFGTSLSPHIGSAWRVRHNNKQLDLVCRKRLSQTAAQHAGRLFLKFVALFVFTRDSRPMPMM